MKRVSSFLRVSIVAAACVGLAGAPGSAVSLPDRPFVDVRDFGAKPDDSTGDDAAGINRALDNAAATRVGVVYVPEGTWDVSTSIRIPSRVTLLLSQNATIRLKPGAALGLGIVTNRNSSLGDLKTDSDIRIVGGTIDGNGVVPSAGHNRGIFLCKCSRSTIEGVTVRNTAEEGIRIHATHPSAASEHNLIRGCTVIRRQATVENIMLSTHLPEPTNRAGAPACIRYCRVEGCYSSGGSHGITLFNARFCELTNNVCEGNAHRGIILSPTCEDCLVSGNIVQRAGSTGIHLAYDAKRCVIANNIVSSTVADGSGRGIEGQGIKAYAGFRDLVVTGNQVSENATDGIALEGGGASQDFIISSNIAAGNGRDGIRVYAGKIVLATPYDISHGSVTGNVCRGNKGSGIRFGTDDGSAKAKSVAVTGNHLHDNGRWGIHAEAEMAISIGANSYDGNSAGNENVTRPRP